MPIDDMFTILDEELNARIRYATLGFSQGGRMVLGGTAGENGGAGGPPGGFIGQLAQRYVAYDTTEAATLSGESSLVDNLNHIRYRVQQLETGSGGGGHIIQDDGFPFPQRSNLNFVGATLLDDEVNDATVVTISGGPVAAGPGIDVVSNTVGLGLDSILVQKYSGTAPAEEFFTINEALEKSHFGDVVYLNADIFIENISVPSGVVIKGNNSIISGTVTLMGDSRLEDLTVKIDGNSGNAVIGVQQTDDGTAYIRNCIVEISNAGGPAVAVLVQGGGVFHAEHTDLIAETGTPGYAAVVTMGDFYQRYGLALGSTPLLPYSTEAL